MRRIVFTGGGTGGHIIPNVAIIKKLREKYSDIEILYIGSRKGPESKMIPDINIPYKSIPTGKLRRYFSFQNFTDFFRIPFGIVKAYRILKKFKPHVVFSKGGYVSLPVVYAARLAKIPVVLHESDVSPGLANKLCSKRADILCLAHYESQRYFPHKIKQIVTGNPVREIILNGNGEKAFKKTHFERNIPIILIIGGSQGAKHINEEISLAANELVTHYQIIHICGKGKVLDAIPLPEKYKYRYIPLEYANKELADIYEITDLVISRSGANTLAEFDALDIPAILIPIGKAVSRGDQLLNAFAYQEMHPETKVIEDELLSYKTLINAVHKAIPHQNFQKKQRSHQHESEGTKKIIAVLDNYLGEACIKKEVKKV